MKFSPAKVFVVVMVFLMPQIVVAESFRFAALGDSRGSNNGLNEPILTELVTALIADQVDLVAFSGDLVNNGTESQLSYWVEVFMEPLQAAGIQVYACRGNHDASYAAWNTVFSGDYAFPDNGPPGEINITYAVEHKNALFLMMHASALTLNYEWLAEHLASTSKPHVFVTNHYPAFSVNHAASLSFFTDLRNAMWNSLYEAGSPTFFVGHDHFYNHARIQDAAGNWIHQYVVGTAGAPLYDWNGSYFEAGVELISHYKNYGYALVEVDGPDVTIIFKQRTSPGVYEDTDDVFTYRTPKAAPKARFSAMDTSGALPLNVFFTDESAPGAGTISGWLWDFGDGATSTEQNPMHTYTSYGVYTVTLTVTNEYGSNSISTQNFVTAGLPALEKTGVVILALLLFLGGVRAGRRRLQEGL